MNWCTVYSYLQNSRPFQKFPVLTCGPVQPIDIAQIASLARLWGNRVKRPGQISNPRHKEICLRSISWATWPTIGQPIWWKTPQLRRAEADQPFYLATFVGNKGAFTVFVEDCSCYGEGVNAWDPPDIKMTCLAVQTFPLGHVIA